MAKKNSKGKEMNKSNNLVGEQNCLAHDVAGDKEGSGLKSSKKHKLASHSQISNEKRRPEAAREL